MNSFAQLRPAIRCVIVFLLFACARSASGAEDPAAKILAEPEGYAAVIVGNHIPAGDGTPLYATIYKPRDQPHPLPVVFTFTPYNADAYDARGEYFARHGYVFATVDVRGRGNSGGTFEPFLTEGSDGASVVEWLAKQPWSNGKVAMWGGSYAGEDQWLVAGRVPPHLVTIVPVASAHPGVDFPRLQQHVLPVRHPVGHVHDRADRARESFR